MNELTRATLKKNYCRVLNIPLSANLKQVKEAFRKAAKMYHPDTNGGIGNPAKFKNVIDAYRFLEKNYGFEKTEKKDIKRKIEINKWAKTHWPKRSSTNTYHRKNSIDSNMNMSKNPVKNRRGFTFGYRVGRDLEADPSVVEFSFNDQIDRMNLSKNEQTKTERAMKVIKRFKWLALPAITKALKNRSPALTEGYLICLAVLGDWASIITIGKYLDHKNAKIACLALKMLKNMDKEYAYKLLDRLHEDSRSIKYMPFRVMAAFRYRDYLRNSYIGLSELYIALILSRRTHSPIPMILDELGLVNHLKGFNSYR